MASPLWELRPPPSDPQGDGLRKDPEKPTSAVGGTPYDLREPTAPQTGVVEHVAAVVAAAAVVVIASSTAATHCEDFRDPHNAPFPFSTDGGAMQAKRTQSDLGKLYAGA